MKKIELNVCGGCAAKMGPGSLEDLLKDLNTVKREDILIGFESKDDACVIKIDEKKAIIQTLDFFPPMVQEARYFGQIAAANATSDVFAMGGDVISALNILAYPEDGDMEVLREILAGAVDKLAEISASITGGHSIHDHLVKYGLSVTGIVDPNKIWRNDTAEVGDLIGLTKPLGTGLILNAWLEKMTSYENYINCVNSMTTLNKNAADVLKRHNPTAVTDVTGFGLLGHLREMAGANGFLVNVSDIEILPGAYEASGEFLFTQGAQRNRKYIDAKFSFDDIAMEEVLYDPQTSGGLLFSAKRDESYNILEDFGKSKIDAFYVGEITESGFKVDW